MSSGRKILKSIDQSLRGLGQQVNQAEQQIQASSEELIGLEQQQAETFSALARLRLDSVLSGEVESELQIADDRVSGLLEQRRQERGELSAKIESVYATQQAVEHKRSELSSRAHQAARDLDAQQARTQERLQEMQGYLRQLEKTRQAERIAEHAEEKQQEALENSTEKGAPFEDDPLFIYLWQRAYGTSEYQANSLVRYLDRWVAGLCDYHDARPNYAMLLDIPKRLQTHAERLREAADREFVLLQELEEAAADEDGIPALVAMLEQSEAELTSADQETEELGQALTGLLQDKADYASGEDERYKQAMTLLSELMESENLRVLYYRARVTAGAEDDRLVEILDANSERIQDLQQAMRSYRDGHDKQIQKLRELEQLRSRFKREKYDDVHSSFANKALLMMVLNQFLQGVSNSDELWDTLRRERRHRPVKANPDFGSGGLRRRGGGWPGSFPGSPRRGGGSSWGGGPRPGGGGFRTGGGF